MKYTQEENHKKKLSKLSYFEHSLQVKFEVPLSQRCLMLLWMRPESLGSLRKANQKSGRSVMSMET